MTKIPVLTWDDKSVEIRVTVRDELVKSIESDEPYSTEIHAQILVVDEDDREIVVGRLEAFKVNFGKAVEDGDDTLFNIFDDISFGAYAVYEELFEPNSDELRVDLPIEDDCKTKLLIITNVKIDPEYQGRNFGLILTARAIELFADLSTLVVMNPDNADDRDEIDTGVANYFAKLGFTLVPDSVYLMYDTTKSLPEFEESYQIISVPRPIVAPALLSKLRLIKKDDQDQP